MCVGQTVDDLNLLRRHIIRNTPKYQECQWGDTSSWKGQDCSVWGTWCPIKLGSFSKTRLSGPTTEVNLPLECTSRRKSWEQSYHMDVDPAKPSHSSPSVPMYGL